MHSPLRTTIFVTVLLAVANGVLPHSSATGTQTGNGTISGRVTMGNDPMPNFVVGVQRIESNSLPSGTTRKATTDQDGRYLLTGLAAGRYRVLTLSSVYVLAGETQRTPLSSNPSAGNPSAGKVVTLNENELVENVDLAVTRGGVITGKVIDADGHPLIGERVTLTAIDEQGRKRTIPVVDATMYEIDDRGVYRVFGLPAGRYIASAGQVTDGSSIRIGHSGPTYQRTFHPDATEENRAKIVELGDGHEATGIDIEIGSPVKTYEATGRIVSAETGQPLPGVLFSYGGLRDGASTPTSSGSSGTPTNAQGEFRIEGLPNGRYAAFLYTGAGFGAVNNAGADYYSDPVPFEIHHSNVSGVEIRVNRAGSIAGVIAAEDGNDRAILSQASQVYVYALSMGGASSAAGAARPGGSSQSRLQNDGSFRITGLSPGKVRIALGGLPGLQLVRVERAPTASGDGLIELAASQHVTGARLVVSYGTGVIRGTIRVQGGTLPAGTRMLVSYKRANVTGATGATVVADARGQFLAERLAPGTYELTLVAMIPGSNTTPPTVEQSVAVTNGSVAQVTLTLDLSAQ